MCLAGVGLLSLWGELAPLVRRVRFFGLCVLFAYGRPWFWDGGYGLCGLATWCLCDFVCACGMVGDGEVPIYAWICLSLVAWVMRDSELAFALVRLEGVDEWIDHGHVRALRFGWSLCVGDVLLMCDASLLVGCFRVESGVVRFRVSLLSRQLVNSRSCLTLFALRQCI